jgi:hypothetical protein
VSKTYRVSDIKLEKSGMELIQEERRRQIAKGYTAEYDQRWTKWELRAAADNYLDAHRIRWHDRLNGGPNRKWRWPLEKWKPTPDDRVREFMIAGALYLAEVERRELAGETAVGSRAKVKTCAIKIERELKNEGIRQLKRAHYKQWCRSVGEEPDPRVHARYVPGQTD